MSRRRGERVDTRLGPKVEVRMVGAAYECRMMDVESGGGALDSWWFWA